MTDPNMPWGSTPPLTPEQELDIEQNYVKVKGIKYIKIPGAYLWAEDLKPNEKLLMGFIYLADNEKHCWASNSTLAEWMQLPVQTIKNLIVGLKKKGYLEQVSYDGRYKRVLRCLK